MREGKKNKYLLTPFKMGDDNIALGRQSFLEDGMEKGEDTHLLKEQHTLHSLAGKR